MKISNKNIEYLSKFTHFQKISFNGKYFGETYLFVNLLKNNKNLTHLTINIDLNTDKIMPAIAENCKLLQYLIIGSQCFRCKATNEGGESTLTHTKSTAILD